MKYSYNWLQKHIAAPLPSTTELEQKIIFHAFEVEEVETVGDDTVFEIKVLPDRAGDALSHYGMAREIAGLYKLPLLKKEPADFSEKKEYAVSIETPLCTRYSVSLIEGVKVSESPAEIKSLLSAVGQKTINAVADATNYVLLDSGQPTHAFDADKIVGTLVVRMAKEGESVITLSDEEKVLSTEDIVIADDEGVLAIAGVKGGKRAEVTTDTTKVLVEAAHFDSVAIRKTARRLNLVTDAAKRFENNISADVVSIGMETLVSSIQAVCGGAVVASTDIYTKKQQPRTILFTEQDITRVLGGAITGTTIEAVFGAYGYTYTKEGGVYTLSVPYYRQDIAGAADIAEEVGRATGYEIIPRASLPFSPIKNSNTEDSMVQLVKAFCLAEGHSEVMTYSFCKKGDVTVVRGAKNKSDLRTNLSDGLRASFELNRLQAPLLGMFEVKLFEVGTVFLSKGDMLTEEVRVALADKKGVQEYTLAEFVAQKNIDTAMMAAINLPEASQQFVPWSTYPFIVRDVSVWLTEGDTTAATQLETYISDFAAKHAIGKPVLFDTFSKDGKTSFAYRLVFQSYDHTLTDAEVAETIAPLFAAITTIEGAELR